VFSAERKLISMSHHLDVLQALLRLVRRRKRPCLATLVHATGTDEVLVRRALFALARNGLIQRTPSGLTLTLAGLAIAVATPARRRRPGQLARPRTTARPVSGLTRVTRHRAA
jgi:DNA-binding IclR family transcriptional regulator